MSSTFDMGNRKVAVPEVLGRKSTSSCGVPRGKVVAVTVYDYPTARLLDEAGVDIVLVGDSLGMVLLGSENTLAVTVDETVHQTRAVRRGVRRALLVADMPYGSYHVDDSDAVRTHSAWSRKVAPKR